MAEKCKKLSFTVRESEVVILTIQGKSYKDTADRLYISEKTVSKHISNIYKKLGINSKIELMKKLDSM